MLDVKLAKRKYLTASRLPGKRDIRAPCGLADRRPVAPRIGASLICNPTLPIVVDAANKSAAIRGLLASYYRASN
jgi:hypothetical protein